MSTSDILYRGTVGYFVAVDRPVDLWGVNVEFWGHPRPDVCRISTSAHQLLLLYHINTANKCNLSHFIEKDTCFIDLPTPVTGENRINNIFTNADTLFDPMNFNTMPIQMKLISTFWAIL